METIGDAALVRRGLGRRIRGLRRRRGLSQNVFSMMVSINRTYLIDVEMGRRNVSIDNLYKISRGLDMHLSDLFEGVDQVG